MADSKWQIADSKGPSAIGYQPSANLLQLAASAERYSEHPLAEAVRQAALERGLKLLEPQDFEALPGLGVRARVNGSVVTVGSRRMILSHAEARSAEASPRMEETLPHSLRSGSSSSAQSDIGELEAQGKTLLYVACDDELAGVLAAADTARPEIPSALAAVRALGLKHIELLTGDNERTAAELAHRLGVRYRAQLLPEDKIAVVKEYQAKGHTVIMVGDGVNDAPALAQADVGIAMGAAGTDIAIEAAHVALMRDDWTLVPELLRLARRTMGVVKMNIAFTAIYNLVGLSLAALGFLPPIFAAAAQSLPDIGILANSSRLLRPPRTNPTNDIPNR
jgi:Cd2+/Zn2+-exporting ATPase/Cu+-exporting ATPase